MILNNRALQHPRAIQHDFGEEMMNASPMRQGRRQEIPQNKSNRACSQLLPIEARNVTEIKNT